jgi:hypothetical protein
LGWSVKRESVERGKCSDALTLYPATAGWEGGDPFFHFTQGGGPSRQGGTGLALGYYLPAPPGRKDAALRAGRVELVAVSGCARRVAGQNSQFQVLEGPKRSLCRFQNSSCS